MNTQLAPADHRVMLDIGSMFPADQIFLANLCFCPMRHSVFKFERSGHHNSVLLVQSCTLCSAQVESIQEHDNNEKIRKYEQSIDLIVRRWQYGRGAMAPISVQPASWAFAFDNCHHCLLGRCNVNNLTLRYNCMLSSKVCYGSTSKLFLQADLNANYASVLEA